MEGGQLASQDHGKGSQEEVQGEHDTDLSPVEGTDLVGMSWDQVLGVYVG
jgi:hypothetical protein